MLGCLHGPGAESVWREGSRPEILCIWGGLPQPDVMDPFGGKGKMSVAKIEASAQGDDSPKRIARTSLAVQWLRFCASTARGMGSIPGWRAKIPHTMVQPKKENIY